MATTTLPNANVDDLVSGGEALRQMLGSLDVNSQIKELKQQVLDTKSPSKRDSLIKRLKYLAGLQKLNIKPDQAYILHNMPVAPPLIRPAVQMGNNRIEFSDVNNLVRDHITVNNSLKGVKDFLPNDQLINERKALYEGAKAVFGLGDAITGSSRGKQLKGYIKQISGETGPKGGLFHSKLLSRKQDFSGRATISANPDVGFNEAAVPVDMLWTMYEFHIIRDLVKNGYDTVSAKKAVEARDTAATNSFNKLIKQVPIILNRAPTLMRTNITAMYPVPVQGRTVGLNPLHLPLFAGDYDGDALSMFLPMTPEAVEEAKKKLTPSAHIYDYRKAGMNSMVAPGHEAIVGAVHMTEPNLDKPVVEFDNEEQVLAALKRGEVDENTPIKLRNGVQ
jgi:DNA-directed RNA polymerase subunit beta'